MTLQNHYSMNIIKYKVKYILYFIFILKSGSFSHEVASTAINPINRYFFIFFLLSVKP